MLFRSKVDSPWCAKGKIFVPNYCDFDPRKFPDVFEQVEEKNDYEKWYVIMTELGITGDQTRIQISNFLDSNGYDAKNAFDKVCVDDDKYKVVKI